MQHRSSTRRGQHNIHNPGDNAPQLFIDPMLGTALSMYVEKDVDDRDALVTLITKHGGSVSPGYSSVTYVLVDPLLPSGQNLYRQYAGKKGKVVLNYRWIHECIKSGSLQTFKDNWAGCKVTGNESPALPVEMPTPAARRRPRTEIPADGIDQVAGQIAPPPPPPILSSTVSLDTHFPFQIYTAPPQQYTTIAPQQTHLLHRPWTDDYTQPPAQDQLTATAGSSPDYDFRSYRDEQAGWVGGTYYDPSYDQTYDQSSAYMDDAPPSAPGPATPPVEAAPPAAVSDEDVSRGRKRTRTDAEAPSTSSLVTGRRRNARSPTPPTRVIKSTYGGNLFTAEDVLYLKKYIDYCHEQGLVLSLREICERIAVKAPHHTFYSWRRYCNKHHIRLGGYSMVRPDSDSEDNIAPMPNSVPLDSRIPGHNLNRSPSPPHALFRSTTGKGVAFTEDDISFLITFMEYRKAQHGRLDMVTFWKDVAAKAPHHSRASWMKFWRRHKHEYDHQEGDAIKPAPPEKKMRYSRQDDVLLAKFFAEKQDGTSDQIFQAFGRLYPHHPWKGWQEHHRIHKAKIDHFIEQLKSGVNIDVEN